MSRHRAGDIGLAEVGERVQVAGWVQKRRDHGGVAFLDILEERWSRPHDDPWETREFHCREVAPDNYLLTYTLQHGGRLTRRATLWRRRGGEWKIVFHQGTVVEPEVTE